MKVKTTNIGRRPYVSDKGARKSGPTPSMSWYYVRTRLSTESAGQAEQDTQQSWTSRRAPTRCRGALS